MIVHGQDRQAFSPGIDLQHRDVRSRIRQQHLGRELAPVAQDDHDLLAALDDVVVGDDHPVRANHHARAQRLGDAVPRKAQAAAEHAPERIHRLAHHAAAIDIDHGRRGPLHHRGEGHLDGADVGRHAPSRLGQGRRARQ